MGTHRPLGAAPKTSILQVLLKPESGLEPLTYRLQGDCSTS
jgi:hypothetical protein